MRDHCIAARHAHTQGATKSSKQAFLTKSASYILLCIGLLISIGSQAQNITYSGKSATLQQVFAAIKDQSGYKFFYRNEDLAGLKKVTIELKKASIHEALRIVLEGQPIDYYIEGNTVFINRQHPSAIAVPQVVIASPPGPGEVRGTVSDAQNNRLPGITILAKRSKELTVSGENGEFILYRVQPGDTLVLSSVNYETVSIPANPNAPSIVILNPKITGLTEVTVYNTGYQQVSKERATGAFAQADTKVFQERVVSNDVVSRLDGLIPGLTVTPNSFTVNANNSAVKTNNAVIRGIGSVSADRTPIYVVNGIVVPDFSTVNPQDIEDITVLKDAAAAAIYGARASNGVIVVHTREGKKRQRLEVNYSGNYTFQGKPDFNYEPLMNSAQFIQTARETFDPTVYPYESVSWGPIMPHMKVLYDQQRGIISSATADHLLDSMSAISNRAQYTDLFVRNAMMTNHTISASGGTENYTVYASLGYTGVQSSTPGDRNNSYKVNITQTFNFGKRINLGLNTSLIQNTGGGIGGVPVDHYFLPYQLFRDNTGKDINMAPLVDLSEDQRADYQSRSRINLDYYPLQDRSLSDSKFSNQFMNVTANVNVKLWKGLSYRGLFGYISNPGSSELYQDNTSYTQRMQLMQFTIAPTVNSIPQYLLPVNGGMSITTNSSLKDWTVRNQLVYNSTPRHGKDALYVQAGQEGQESFTSRKQLTILGYDRQLGTYPLLNYFDLSQPIFGTVTGFAMLGNSTPYNVNETTTRFSSYFAMAGYTYNNRYTLEASWRRDRSNLFGGQVAGQNKATYSLGGKWMMHNERFMEPITWISDLGLRLSHGITGNSPVAGEAASEDILEARSQSNTGSVAGDALVVGSIANPQLTWEATHTTNVGLDFGFLEGKLQGSFNYYYRKTDNLLGTLRLNRFSGFDITRGNVGAMENKGLELSLQSQNLQLGDFRWNTLFVLGFNRNKLLSLGIVSASAYSNTPMGRLFSNYIPGYSMETLWAYRFAGLDNMGDPMVYLADKSTTKAPNAAGVKDMVYAGTTQPVVNGGLRNTFSYRGWNLSLNMVYSLGHKMRADVPKEFTGQLGQNSGLGGQNITSYFLDRWKQPGDETKTNIPSYVADPSIDYSRRSTLYYVYSDINVISASYIKLRDITLSYDLSRQTLGRIGLKRANIFVQAGNFMVWKDNKRGIDPEYYNMRGGLKEIPASKHTYSLGINITL